MPGNIDDVLSFFTIVGRKHGAGISCVWIYQEVLQLRDGFYPSDPVIDEAEYDRNYLT